MRLAPAPLTHADRLRLAHAIAARAREVHGPDLMAVGLYGSMARATDGPYSDIEMYCILRTPGVEFSHEWVAGPWKAEVDFYGADLLLEKAAEVEGRWPLVAGSLHDVLVLEDPEGFFPLLREVAGSRPPELFHAAIESVLTGEMYEFAGKLANITAGAGTPAYLAPLAVKMADYGAYLIGLHNRRYYTTGGQVLQEALTLPHRPAGFDALARLVTCGRLADRDAVTAACEEFWTGVVAWAEEHGYTIVAPREIPF